jgi:hypothetical protein
VIRLPNWCENDLVVSGPRKKLDEFKQAVSGDSEALVADKIIPYPKVLSFLDKLNSFEAQIKRREGEEPEIPDDLKGEYSELLLQGALEGYDIKRDGFNQGGYEWCRANWGTKWGFCHSRIVDEDDGHIFYQFDTAWSPPEPLIVKMGEMFPELEFELRYYECGAGFQGCLRIEFGKVVERWEDNYSGDRGG